MCFLAYDFQTNLQPAKRAAFFFHSCAIRDITDAFAVRSDSNDTSVF
jgi:hypothetical protein